ncbi:MAG: serine/threonine protein kinase [Planctomycetes bacterium]|nr:serine/threonine protein kinase [Planctomycetota bacterium]
MASLDEDKTPVALPVQPHGPGRSGFLPPSSDPDKTPLALPAIGPTAPVAGPDRGPRASHAKLSKRIGAYEVTAILGKGGMGTVFLAKQEGLDRVVALKVLSTAISNDRVFIERFQFEARASAQLNHPNIVQGIDVGRDAPTGFYYFAMEYVNGPSLKQVLAEQHEIPERRALEIVRDIARGLDCAARHGIVHRDIKPDNILLAPAGEAKLTDLGLARSVNIEKGVTHSGETVGTPFYMAPEQIMGQADRIDIRTDIYSLGATLYHLVVGKPPYEGEAAAVIMTKHLKEKAPNAQKDAPGVSEACSKLIARMMAKEPLQRFQTPNELLEAIEKILGREVGSGPRPFHPKVSASNSRLQALRRTGHRGHQSANVTLLLLMGAGGLLVLSGLAYWYLVGSAKPPDEQDPAVLKKTEQGKKSGVPEKSGTDPAKTGADPAKTAALPDKTSKPDEKFLYRFDFENLDVPPGFQNATIDTKITCNGSKGALKAPMISKNKYFYNGIEFEDRSKTFLFTVTDKTYFGLRYYSTSSQAMKIQMWCNDGTSDFNIALVLDSVADGKWNTLKVRMVDAFRNSSGSGPLIKAGLQIRTITIFSGKPDVPSDLYIDNFEISETP